MINLKQLSIWGESQMVWRALWLCVFLFCVPASFAQTSAQPTSIPEPLQPWIGWALQDATDRNCPFLIASFQTRQCAWPGTLKLIASDTGLQFQQHWTLFSKSRIPIPASDGFWPDTLSVNQQNQLLVGHNGRASIELEAGEYEVAGRIPWQRMPESISIPPEIAMLSLSVNGRTLQYPKLDSNGRLWLIQRQSSPDNENKETEDKLSLRVYRHLVDDLPFRIETHIELEVSGKAREMVLGKILFDGYQLQRFDSPLPARIEKSGRLRVQLRPGQWNLDLAAHIQEPVSKVFLENSEQGFWPEEEVWVFEGVPELRQVQVEGVEGIDPNQTSLPDAWKQWPAYRLSSGQAMTLSVLRRGDPQPSPNRLSNHRDLWLDFDGSGITVRDRLQGVMSRDWRLNMVDGIELGRLTLDGMPQVITEVNGRVGAEVRQAQLNAEALSRFELKSGTHKHHFSSTGWQSNLDNLSAVLHLPPGWRALVVTGVDSVSNTWLNSWSVWDVFIVLIAVAAIIKLRGPWAGLSGGLSLLLIYPEQESFLYLLLNLIAVLAVLALLPQGRLLNLLKWYSNGALIVLVLWMLGFMVEQARLGLYPQLQLPWLAMGQLDKRRMDQSQFDVAADYDGEEQFAETMPGADVASMPATVKELRKSLPVSAERVRGKAPASEYSLEQTDPSLSAQTGPGVPSWYWQQVRLSWNGPVTQQEEITVWLVSPTESRILCALRVVFGLLLLVSIVNLKRAQGKWEWSLLRNAGAGSTVILLSLFVLMPYAPKAQAEMPSEAMLNTLKQRLLQEKDCTPDCLSVLRTRIDLSNNRLTLRLHLNALQDVIFTIPQSANQWQLDGLLLNDMPHPLSKPLQTFVPAGDQELVITGWVPAQQEFQLNFSIQPHNLDLHVSGFTIKGLENGRLRGNSLYFYPLSDDPQQADKQQLKPQPIPPFVLIERELRFGLNWYLETRVRRIAPPQGGISLEIPLLEGESVTSQNVLVEARKAQITLQPGEAQQVWYSALDKSSLISLTAAQTPLWMESWIVNPSALWHLEFDGVPVVKESSAVAQWRPRWRPYPGEKLSMNITRPQAVNGPTKTIDWIRQTWVPGQRESAGKLRMHILTSKGTEQRIRLPAQSLVKQVKLDNELRSVEESNVNVIVPLNPGEHWLELEWREPSRLQWQAQTPQVEIEDHFVNNSISVEVPRNRWVLLVGGPAMGPAVLFWGILIVAILSALCLGRMRQLPLKTWHWLLLIVGLCAGSIEAIVPVVLWFWLMHKRQSAWYQRLNPVQFNFLQVVLGIFSLATFMLLLAAIPNGLIGSPDMGVTGNGSSQYSLNWFVDRGENALATAWIISLPLWVYRGLMLVWSLWLVVYMLRWLKWGWTAFVHNGYWHSTKPKQAEEQ